MKKWFVVIVCICVVHVLVVHGFLPIWNKYNTHSMASDLRRFQLELDSYAKRSGGYPDDLDAFLDNHYGDASNGIRQEDWYKSIWYYDPTPPDSKNKLKKTLIVSVLPSGVYFIFSDRSARLVYN